MKVTRRSRLLLRLQSLVFAVLFIAIIGMLGWLSTQYVYQADWTRGARNTISAGSQQLLGLRFSASVQLELVEHRPEGLLQFRMLKGDFRRFEGSWRLQTLPDGSSLLYDLTVQGCLGMPVALIEQRLRSDLSANLLAVEREAQRRFALS